MNNPYFLPLPRHRLDHRLQIPYYLRRHPQIYTQISSQIKDAILEKHLTKDDALPSIRALSADLKVSVITTKKSYEELEKEGMIYSVPGKGFFVDDPDIEYLAVKKTLGVEEELGLLIRKAKLAQIDRAQFVDMVEILWEEDYD